MAKSSRGKNARGKKITAIVPLPCSPPGVDQLLVTSNDSRVRLYNLIDKSCEAKYRGHENTSSQIRSNFSDDGRYLICGSEDRHVYIYDSGIGAGGTFVGWRGKKDGGHESFSGALLLPRLSLIPLH